jgi:hypothetical protein
MQLALFVAVVALVAVFAGFVRVVCSGWSE